MTSRFHNQLLRARVQRTAGGFLLAFTRTSPGLDLRFIAAGLYEVASEMERRSHDMGACWAITVDAARARIAMELARDDSAARAEQFLHDVLAGFNLQ